MPQIEKWMPDSGNGKQYGRHPVTVYGSANRIMTLYGNGKHVAPTPITDYGSVNRIAVIWEA